MYLPLHFKADDPALAVAIMRAHPLASLVSVDESGLPFVTHLPVHTEQHEGGFRLWAHVARPNPHWRLLQASPRALVAFLGPHGYQSPAIYPDKERVPSWNYLAVHCEVEAKLVEDPLAKDRLLKKLIGDHEPAYAEQWRGLGEDFAHKMLAGIVGLEFTVTSWQCKIKLNQHRREAHQRMHETYAAGNEHERDLARWMERIGLVQEEQR